MHTPSSTTTTQQTQLPSWLNQANQYGANQAAQIYQGGGPQYYPGSTVAPLSPIQENYLTNANNVGQNGNPALNSATNYATQAAGGAYLNSNPYLDATFNNAANAVQNRVSSEFAGNGRNLEASIPVQNDQMNQLATQIYGGNYQNERQLQAQAAGMAPSLNAGNLANLGAQATAGNLLQQQSQNYADAAQNRWNYDQNLPRNNLGWYMNTINSLAHPTTQTNQTPVYQNHAAGAIGGALAGSQIGSSFGGNGTAWGTGLGALAGYFM